MAYRLDEFIIQISLAKGVFYVHQINKNYADNQIGKEVVI